VGVTSRYHKARGRFAELPLEQRRALTLRVFVFACLIGVLVFLVLLLLGVVHTSKRDSGGAGLVIAPLVARAR
jgi:hypothetical protein